jgi:hypothetical protein
MSAKHTSGPWSVDGGEEVRGERFVRVTARGGYVVARTKRNGIDDAAEANARLIAAAPELLEALKRMSAVALDLIERSGGAETEEPEFQRARAAIAKAEGK